MIKKILAAFILALVIGLGMVGVINITHAQEIEAQAETAEVDQEGFEYEYSFQYGDQNGDCDPNQFQNRQRTQMREFNDGECMGEGDPQQLRLHRAEKQNLMGQAQQNRRDGTCFGNCGRQGLGSQDN